MLAAGIGDYVVAIVILVVVIGSYTLSRRIQPFWVSRDGRRFITIARELDQADEPTGVRRDLHAGLDGDQLIVKLRVGMRSRRSRYQVTERRRLDDAAWWYVLRPVDAPAELRAVAARVPADSPLATRLDELRAASDR